MRLSPIYYIQCPHCNAFMNIYCLTYSLAVWTCQNKDCNKKFKARIVKIVNEFVEVINET